MNYFNTSTLDDDEWREIIKKKNIRNDIVIQRLPRDENIKVVTNQTFTDDIGMASVALGLPTPNSNGQNWAYFVTVAFPTNHKFKIKHMELLAGGRSRIVFCEIKYGDCTQEEQYRFILYKLDQQIQHIADYYDLFFEQTKEGNIHFHGRLGYDGKKKSMKDIKALLHRLFECPTQYNRFIDIKVYEPKKWNDYDNKKEKNYQTLDYPHFKNV